LRDIRFSVGNQAHVAEAHERILAACRARDGDAAAAAMHQHVSGLESLVRTHYQHMLTDPTAVVARPGRALGQST
jgi:GntR family transcriptional regulator, transcriptional repressor for pyruvate dehydrogenase complex